MSTQASRAKRIVLAAALTVSGSAIVSPGHVTATVADAAAASPRASTAPPDACPPKAICTDRSETLWSVIAHPDDEFSAWGMMADRPDTYVVLVTATRGEGTRSCMTPEESRPEGDPELENGTFIEPFTGEGGDGGPVHGLQGPYRYQGPRSPVGEPDKGESHPLGNPWQGRGTEACAAARIASWHWFLDDMAALDTGLPDFGVANDPMLDDDYRGRVCPDIACADIWADEDGARVAFHLENGSLTADEVTAALQTLRKHRAAWGLPITPSESVLAAAYWNDGDDCPFQAYPHHEHRAVQDAIFETDLGAGPRYGVTCQSDDRFVSHPGPVLPTSPVVQVQGNFTDPVTEQRIGPWVAHYGWLFDTYTWSGGTAEPYWKR